MNSHSLDFEAYWNDLAAGGWFAEAHRASDIYPMPGDEVFDIDDLFMQIPIFPSDNGLPATYACDQRWLMPAAWDREFETRPLGQRTLLFGLYNDRPVRSKSIELAAQVFIRRCAYLEMFRSRKALSVSTVRQHLHVFRYIAGYAVGENKLITELDYGDLLAAIRKMPESIQKQVPAAHGLMRWWRAVASPGRFSGYTPPPSLNAIQADNVDSADKLADAFPRGFNAAAIRSDEGAAEDSQTWQPLPDAFVAAMGEFCLRISVELSPMYYSFLCDVLEQDPSGSSKEAIATAAKKYSWPPGLEITHKINTKKVGNICQFSSIFLLAILLGPRATEITALPAALIRKIPSGDYVIDGSTFKLSQSTSGQKRDWPIHPNLGEILERQQNYIRLVENKSFGYLFRSHATLVGGSEPIRQLGKVLNSVLHHTGFKNLLNGSSFHPHRFRKTTARLIVIALHGGPLVLRRLFGHQHLEMTLKYILTNQDIVDELREIAEEEQRKMAAELIRRRGELKGGGAIGFNKAILAAAGVAQQLPEVFVPDGRREQATVDTFQIIEVLAADPAEGLRIKVVLPGLVICWKPSDEAGECCKAGELPNIAKCSTRCIWHLQMPEYLHEARQHIKDLLRHLEGEVSGSLKWVRYSALLIAKLNDYPELRAEFADHPLVRRCTEIAQ